MPDYGLLAGLATGFNSAAQSYISGKKDAQDLAMKKREMQLRMMQSGVEQNDDGTLNYRPDVAAKQDYETQQYDPESDASQKSRGLATGLLKAAGVGDAENIIPEGTSAKDLNSENGLLGKTIGGVYSNQGRLIVGDRMAQRNNIMERNLGLSERRLNLREGQMASQAGQSIEKDPIHVQVQKTNNSLDRALSIMDNQKLPVTGKTFALLQQDMINAMAPGGAATEGKVNREMTETLAQQLNDLQLKFGNVQDLRKEQPQVFNQLRALINNVKSDYQTADAQRVKDLAGNFDYVGSAPVKNTVNDKVTRYSKPQGLLGPQMSEAEKQGALEYIKNAKPGDPKAEAMKQVLGVK